MKKKITYDDVARQLFVCRVDCRRLAHSIYVLRDMACACGLLLDDFDERWFEGLLTSTDELLYELSEFHFIDE